MFQKNRISFVFWWYGNFCFLALGETLGKTIKPPQPRTYLYPQVNHSHLTVKIDLFSITYLLVGKD